MTPEGLDVETGLRAVRGDLIARFASLASVAGVVGLQRRLAEEIAESETHLKGRERETWRHHRHLLRLVGDAVANVALPEHLVRTLWHGTGPAAGVAGQGDSFAFVLDVADVLARSGYVPVVCDLTSLLAIGDLAALSTDHSHTLVLECKDTILPLRRSTSGRAVRQRDRGAAAANYQRTSVQRQADGPTRVAVAAAIPEPEWDVVGRIAQEWLNGATGVAAASLGGDDRVAIVGAEPDEEALALLLAGGPTLTHPASGWSRDTVRGSRPWVRSPVSWPLPATVRHNLLEGDAMLVRLVDLGAFAGTLDVAGITVVHTVDSPPSGPRLWTGVGDDPPVELGPRWLDLVLLTPTPIRSLRRPLAEMAVASRAALDATTGPGLPNPAGPAEPKVSRPPHLAAGDDVSYATVYRDPADGRPLLVFEPETARADPLVWDPATATTVGRYVEGILARS